MLGKRHATLSGHSQPLAISWVKEALPELDKLYSIEAAQMTKVCDERTRGNHSSLGLVLSLSVSL